VQRQRLIAAIVAVVALSGLSVPAAQAGRTRAESKLYGCAVDRITTDPTAAMRLIISSPKKAVAT